MDDTHQKLEHLNDVLTEMGGVLVAFSGGTDSAFLLAAASRALGANALAVTIASELHPKDELEQATRMAKQIGARHLVLEAEPLSVSGVVENSPERCYHCKHTLFGELKRVAETEGLAWVAHGAQVSDLSEHRPGFRAAEELGVRAPLYKAGMTKEEIRALSKEWGLETWDRPAMACYASRVRYGEPLTRDKLTQVATAEEAFRHAGFTQLRVRHHGDTARIELLADEFHRLLDSPEREGLVGQVKALGFSYVTLDLEGYRSGSMDEVLK